MLSRISSGIFFIIKLNKSNKLNYQSGQQYKILQFYAKLEKYAIFVVQELVTVLSSIILFYMSMNSFILFLSPECTFSI